MVLRERSGERCKGNSQKTFVYNLSQVPVRKESPTASE